VHIVLIEQNIIVIENGTFVLNPISNLARIISKAKLKGIITTPSFMSLSKVLYHVECPSCPHYL
jgi:hypothetical protein